MLDKYSYRTGELTNRLSSDTQVIQNAVTVKSLFLTLKDFVYLQSFSGKHFDVSEIFTADYSVADTDVLAECSSHCCAAVCSADHCYWSCAIWWVGPMHTV